MHKLSHRHTENPTHPQERPTRKKSHQTVNERDRTGPGHQKHITILRALVDLFTFGLSERLLTVTTAQKRARGSLSPSSTALSIVDPRVIVVGLGNPGTLYKNTRHNAGQLLLQKLSSQFDYGSMPLRLTCLSRPGHFLFPCKPLLPYTKTAVSKTMVSDY